MILLLVMTLFQSSPTWAQSGLGLVGGSSQRIAAPTDYGSSNDQSAATTQNDPLSQDLDASQGYQSTVRGGMTDANYIDSQGSQLQIQGVAIAAALTRICVQPHGTGTWACAPAAMTALDALGAGSASGNGQATADFFDQTGGPDFDTAPGTTQDIFNEQALETLNELRGMGYTTNEDGSVTLPSGEKVTSSDMMSKDYFANQGLSDSEASAAMAKMGQLTGLGQGLSQNGVGDESANGLRNPASSSGSGAGQALIGLDGESSSGGPTDEIVEEIEYRHRKKPKGYRMPASKAAELSKDFNGTPIGIDMADIFLIVQKKYDEEKNKKTKFINREY